MVVTLTLHNLFIFYFICVFFLQRYKNLDNYCKKCDVRILEFSCLKLDFQTLYRLQRQDFNISNTVNNEKRREDIQEKGNKIFWRENANMKALIFVHLSSGSVSRKLGCLALKI